MKPSTKYGMLFFLLLGGGGGYVLGDPREWYVKAFVC
jgi:hypothetical protein